MEASAESPHALGGDLDAYRDALAASAAAPLRRKLIAHRGWHCLDGQTAQRPVENTREAYLGAARLGLPLAECDVWSTADGEVVLSHDDSVEGTAGEPGRPIAEFNWAELQHLRLRSGASPVLLRTVLEDLRGSGTRLVVELKCSGPAVPLAGLLGSSAELRSAVSHVMSFSLAAVEAFAAALQGGGVGLLWLLDNPVVPYEEEAKNEGETTFDYANETLAMFLSRLGLRGRISKLGCGLHVQYHPCLTPSHVHAWRGDLASILGAATGETGTEDGGVFIGLWTDTGTPSFDRAATLTNWLPAVSAVNTDLPHAFFDDA